MIAVERLDEIAARNAVGQFGSVTAAHALVESRADARAAAIALRAVLFLHQPVPDRAHTISDGSVTVCDICGGRFPCSTILVITAALDVTS